ncbi:hypothetical protein DIC82_14330 [Clostridium beijerinckii]|nr:hypothetical protein DIC82_14330 [Clostridium beijerinckii]
MLAPDNHWASGVFATIFRETLLREGGLKTAKKLISKNSGTDGFVRLWESHRLDLSVEVWVLKNKYKEIFTDEERKMCRDRLKEYGYRE